jgi:environmental stress-induced protein Ves
MPWKNGGGTTTEIVVEPEALGLGDRFLYRVSIADVEASGPFSRFDGYDRHIFLLDGDGMTLSCGEHGVIALRERMVPRSFPGEWDVRGTLVGGPVRDYNLIVDRARADSSLGVETLEAPVTYACEPGTTVIVTVLDGVLAGLADRGDTVVIERPLVLVPTGSTRVVVSTVRRRAVDAAES